MPGSPLPPDPFPEARPFREARPFPEEVIPQGVNKGDSHAAIHMVSASASANRLVLGLCKVDEKSNEITAVPDLLRALELHGCLATIDAMSCQTEITDLIVEQGADYLLQLKKNQGNLFLTQLNRTPPSFSPYSR